ncbi:alpha/beta hydrolase [Streptomyces sp. NPDC088785]|uniref:alpha/beta hydrolase n=1 Tax=Streptomyces sp. NPDC088785 TaxID=3365897 RepID=UPI0037F39778
MTHAAPAATAHTWRPPAPVAPRGTLVVLPGRGEHGPVYERFGRRLSADGYVVHALDTTPRQDAADVLLAVTGVLGAAPAAPVVLVGSDTGALQALGAAARAGGEVPLAGLVLAGTALGAGAPDLDWEAELAARTSCPTHRHTLSRDAEFGRGLLTGPIPAHLLPGDVLPAVPALLLHGAADPLTPLGQVRALARRLPGAALAVVHDGVHDVLNDASHRTTAAAVVQWLERLRADPGLRPILSVEPLAQHRPRPTERRAP